MKTIRLLALAALLSACDDLVKTTTDSGTTDTGSDTTDTTDTTDSCAQLCAQADSSGVAEGACVSEELQGMGYDVVNAPYECAAIAGNEVGCMACMVELGVSDEDCATVAGVCL